MPDNRTLLQKAKDKFALQQMTNAAQPSWIPGQIPTAVGPESGQAAYGYTDVASTGPGGINVVHPNLYTKPVAAHEDTHFFQGTRNGDFQRATDALLPPGPLTPQAYNYGGVAGLQANPQKSVADYNPEQQAQMVQDLTQAQANLPAHMTPAQLQSWDNTKNALERPIQQLAAVPAQDPSLAGRADEWLASRADPTLSGLDHPFSRLMALMSVLPMNTAPQPMQGAPSVALGYANKSKLVR